MIEIVCSRRCRHCGLTAGASAQMAESFCNRNGLVGPHLFADFVTCSNGCGNAVEVVYPHERARGVTCADCFERLTVPR